MAKPVRIGIIRARHDTSVPVIPDQACIAMLMTGDRAVLRFWLNTTRDYLDFVDSPMFPWVDVTLGMDKTRDTQARVAVDALKAKFPGQNPLAGLNGLMVITHPGGPTFDGGATSVDGLGAAVVPVMSSNHTFMCHELGHVLGFDHSYGLDNNGTDYDAADGIDVVGQVYGSPYDLMSSATFANRWLGKGPFYSGNPIFVGPSVNGWPNPNAFSMGPHLSRAYLHLIMPDALAGRMVEAPFPQAGAPVNARIVPASAANGRCLLVLHPPGEPANGVGRVYVEYRIAKGWDAGMDPLGPSLSRVGVVVHTVTDIDRVGPRAYYRGSIPTSSADIDVEVATTPLVVRAERFDPNGEWVDLSVTAGAARGIEIVRGNHSDDMVGVVGAVEENRTPCGDPIRYGTFATATFSQFGVRITGFGGGGDPGVTPPTVAWTVGGVAVPDTNGTISVPVGDVQFDVEHTIDPVVFELALTSRGGERFETPVAVTVTGDGTTATATATFSALGWFEGIHPDDVEILGTCLGKLAGKYRVPPGPLRLPTPDPPWANPAARMLAAQRWFDKAMRAINQTPGLDAPARAELEQILALQAKPAPTILGALGAAGIDFSVPEQDLLQWLGNPEFTPYPAFAQALLTLLGGRRLPRPVFLDVIAFNYENSPGNPSPRRVEEVDVELLKAAVVEGSNIRYGESVTEFGDLLAP